jgi:hypothetical protein
MTVGPTDGMRVPLPRGVPVQPDMASPDMVHRAGGGTVLLGVVLVAVPGLFALVLATSANRWAGLVALAFCWPGVRLLGKARTYATVSGRDLVATRDSGPWAVADLRRLESVGTTTIAGSTHRPLLVLRDRAHGQVTIWPSRLSPTSARAVLERAHTQRFPITSTARTVLEQRAAQAREG